MPGAFGPSFDVFLGGRVVCDDLKDLTDVDFFDFFFGHRNWQRAIEAYTVDLCVERKIGSDTVTSNNSPLGVHNNSADADMQGISLAVLFLHGYIRSFDISIVRLCLF
jgi:hypothetical protein